MANLPGGSSGSQESFTDESTEGSIDIEESEERDREVVRQLKSSRSSGTSTEQDVTQDTTQSGFDRDESREQDEKAVQQLKQEREASTSTTTEVDQESINEAFENVEARGEFREQAAEEFGVSESGIRLVGTGEDTTAVLNERGRTEYQREFERSIGGAVRAVNDDRRRSLGILAANAPSGVQRAVEETPEAVSKQPSVFTGQRDISTRIPSRQPRIAGVFQGQRDISTRTPTEQYNIAPTTGDRPSLGDVGESLVTDPLASIQRGGAASEASRNIAAGGLAFVFQNPEQLGTGIDVQGRTGNFQLSGPAVTSVNLFRSPTDVMSLGLEFESGPSGDVNRQALDALSVNVGEGGLLSPEQEAELQEDIRQRQELFEGFGESVESAVVDVTGSEDAGNFAQGVSGDLLGDVASASAQLTLAGERGIEVAPEIPGAVDEFGATTITQTSLELVGRGIQQQSEFAGENPYRFTGAFAGGIVGGAVAGKTLGVAGRRISDRKRTLGATELDIRDTTQENVVRYFETGGREGDPFPGFTDEDLLRRSQREAIEQQAAEMTPEALRVRFEEAGVTGGTDFFKTLGVEPQGPGTVTVGGRVPGVSGRRLSRSGGGFESPPADSDLAAAYETRGTSFGPEVSPYFNKLQTGRSSFSFRPGLPDLGNRPTTIAARMDIRETSARNVRELNEELLEAEGESVAYTLSPDEVSLKEAEVLTPPGARFDDIGGSRRRAALRRAGIGSDFFIDVPNRGTVRIPGGETTIVRSRDVRVPEQVTVPEVSRQVLGREISAGGQTLRVPGGGRGVTTPEGPTVKLPGGYDVGSPFGATIDIPGTSRSITIPGGSRRVPVRPVAAEGLGEATDDVTMASSPDLDNQVFAGVTRRDLYRPLRPSRDRALPLYPTGSSGRNATADDDTSGLASSVIGRDGDSSTRGGVGSGIASSGSSFSGSSFGSGSSFAGGSGGGSSGSGGGSGGSGGFATSFYGGSSGGGGGGTSGGGGGGGGSGGGGGGGGVLVPPPPPTRQVNNFGPDVSDADDSTRDDDVFGFAAPEFVNFIDPLSGDVIETEQ